MLTFGLDFVRSRRLAKAELAARRRAAYGQLLAVTGVLAHTADTLRLTIEVRSGLGEVLDILTRLRKPVDPFELLATLRRDIEPLYAAWSDIWAVGTADAVQVGNQLVAQAGRVLETATVLNTSRGRLERILIGERWSQKDIDAFHHELADLADARKRLGDLTRQELDIGPAELFHDKDLTS